MCIFIRALFLRLAERNSLMNKKSLVISHEDEELFEPYIISSDDNGNITVMLEHPHQCNCGCCGDGHEHECNCGTDGCNCDSDCNCGK